jgi:putative membrane protein
MMWHHGFTNFGGLAWGALLIVGFIKLAILVALVVLAVFLVRRLGRPNQPTEHHSDDALAVLKARYARGEMTREQFLQMKEDLK